MKTALSFLLCITLLGSVSVMAQDVFVSATLPAPEKPNVNPPSELEAYKAATQLAMQQLVKFTAQEIEYPESLKDYQFEGQVIVDVWINENGEVIQTDIVKSFNSNFNQIVLDAFDEFRLMNIGNKDYIGANRLRLPINFSLK